MPDALQPDKSIVELRALLASYEERLSRTSDRTPDAHAARSAGPAPLFLLNDVALDFRAPALEGYPVIEAPAIVDGFQPAEPEPFSHVYKVSPGVFRVHPRQGVRTAAVIGPFSGPPPSALIATAQTRHPAAPPVRFHIAIRQGEIDAGTIAAEFDATGPGNRILTVPPRHQGFLVATDGSQLGAPDPSSGPSSEVAWGLLLVTVADPPDEISNAWAEFSDIALIFSTASGPEVRLLS